MLKSLHLKNHMTNIKTDRSIRAIIVDDEKAALTTLEKKINLYCKSIKVVALANSAKEGLQAIQNHKPDLVFLDIEMPWMNGFEMLECVGDKIDFDVVFVTAYDQYAIKAFKTKAIDYLLKPVDKDDLVECVERLKGETSRFSKRTLTDLKELIEHPNSNDRILIHGTDTIEILTKDDIVYCQADSNYSYIYTNDNRKITASKTLTNFEEELDPQTHIRIHRSYIINLNYIKQFSSTDGYEVVLGSGERLPVSRRRKEALLEALSKSSNSLV